MSLGIQSSTSSQVNGTSAWQQQRQNFSQLAQALKAGDLGAAQQAFASLTANAPATPDANSPFAKLGQALQSGDVNAAQQAFSALRAGHGHHHHHGGHGGAPVAANAPTPSGTTQAVGTNINTKA